MSTFEIVRGLAYYGHIPGLTLGEAALLRRGDSRLNDAIQSFRDIMQQPSSVAIEDLLTIPRCGLPDNVSADVGAGGNWPRCHDIGDYHAANINVLNTPPAHLARNGNFEYVIKAVTAAYAEYGLQLYWGGVGSPVQDGKSGYQLTMQFVSASAGWLGLAQVASNRPCNSTLWARYLATYLRNGTDAQIRQGWPILIMHELGHNCGTSHTRGGIMNPSLLSSLAPSWKGDVLEPWLRSRYGGKPIVSEPPTWGIYPMPDGI